MVAFDSIVFTAKDVQGQACMNTGRGLAKGLGTRTAPDIYTSEIWRMHNYANAALVYIIYTQTLG